MKSMQLLTLLILNLSTILTKDFQKKENYYIIKQEQLNEFIKEKNQILVYYQNSQHQENKEAEKVFQLIQKQAEKLEFEICLVQTSDQNLPLFRIYLSGFYRDFDSRINDKRILSWAKITFNRKQRLKEFNDKEFKAQKRQRSYIIFKFPKEDQSYKHLLKQFSKYFIKTAVYEAEKGIGFEFDDKPYQMVIIRRFGDGSKFYSQDKPFSASFLQEKAELYSLPIVEAYKEEHSNIFFSGEKIVIYFDEINNSNFDKYQKLSLKYLNKIKFFLSDQEDQSSIALGRFLGVSKKNFPIVRGIQSNRSDRKLLKYKPQNENNIEQFLQNFYDDKLQDYVKEEPIPEHEKKYQFKKLVRGNFEQVVNDQNKHVLVAFVTDWCEHCKEIKPAFNEIKTLLKNDVKDIIFGILNTDKNDIDLRLKSYPTIYLYKKDDKENPINFDGMRDAEVILNFIEEKLNGRSIYNRKMPEEIRKQQEETERKMKEQQQQMEEEEYDL